MSAFKVIAAGFVLQSLFPGQVQSSATTGRTGNLAIPSRCKHGTPLPSVKHMLASSAYSATRVEVRRIITTEDVVNELLRRGIPLDQILIPGQGKEDVLFIPDDFDDPFQEFEDYV